MRPFMNNKQQSIIITQLSLAAATMHHVDELLRRLALAIVQYFGVQVVQCWTHQVNQAGQPAVLLHALARQDSSLPEHVVVNEHIAMVVSRTAGQQLAPQPQLVETIFSPYQSTILKRYGLHYCVGYFLDRNIHLPPDSKAISEGDSPTRFAMTAWLFLQQSSYEDFTSTIGSILEQTITVAESRGLLLPVAASTSPRTSGPISSPLKPLPTLAELIPRRRQDAHLLLESNPFAGSPVISDKRARRLHAAINGRSSVADLCKAMGMDITEIFAVLQVLIAQNLIEIYTPGGQLIDASQIFNKQ